LVRSDGEWLGFKDNSFDCVLCIRLFQLIPRAAKEAVLKEMRRVSKKWLIVEVMYVKPLRHFGRTKSALKKLLGTKLAPYDLDKEILNSGWEEWARVRVKHTKHWVGVYKKLSSFDNAANRIP
jgi:methyltransferase family protein